MIDDDFTTIDFGHMNCVIIENSRGSMDHEYKSHLRDCVGFGSGNTKKEAALAVVSMLRRQADIIEAAIQKRFEECH